MPPFNFVRCTLSACVLVSAIFTPGVNAADAKLDELLTNIAPEAQFIVAIPSLKKLNDDITELLGGMDRADMIAAGRPIDLAKSMLGLGGGIDDRRGAAMFMVPGEDAHPAMLLIAPVVEPDSFLTTNFTRDETSGAYVGATGTEFFIRELENNFMLMGDNKDIVDRYAAGSGAKRAIMQRFGESADAFFNRGDVILMMDQSAAMMLAENFDLPGMLEMYDDPAAVDALNARRDAIVKQIAGIAYVLDADPLGVMVHGLARFVEGSEIGVALKQPANAPSAWAKQLPDKSFYIAAGIDLESAGAMTLLDTMAPITGVDMNALRDVLSKAKGVSFICSPSPAGLTGGVLNDAALVITTDDPEAMHTAMRSALGTMIDNANTVIAAMNAPTRDESAPEPPPAFELAWTDGKVVGDDKITTDAYEVRGAPTGGMVAMVAQTAIFGQSKRGFLARGDSAVVMTFSQRPAVLAAALNAANGSGESLADDGVLKSIRGWMDASSAMEVFINLAQINKFAVNAAKSMGPMGDMPMPMIDIKTPPMGLAFGVGDRSMNSTLALPAPLLAELLRIAEEQMGGRRGGRAPQGGLE